MCVFFFQSVKLLLCVSKVDFNFFLFLWISRRAPDSHRLQERERRRQVVREPAAVVGSCLHLRLGVQLRHIGPHQRHGAEARPGVAAVRRWR